MARNASSSLSPAATARERLVSVVASDRAAKARDFAFGTGGSASGLARNRTVFLGDMVERGYAAANGLSSGQSINYAAKVGEMWETNSVFTAINWLRRNFPDAPVAVRDFATQEVFPAHKMARLFRRPNDAYSYSTLAAGTVLSYVADGNAYWFKEFNGSRQVVALWYRPHWMVTPVRLKDSGNFIDHYLYRPDPRSAPQIIPRESVVHLRNGINPKDETRGLSDLKGLLLRVYTDEECDRFCAAMLSNLGVAGTIFLHKPPVIDADTGALGHLTKENADAIKAAYEENFTGDRRGRTMVLDGEFTVQNPSVAVDADFIERCKDFSQADIAAAIGLPPVVLGWHVGLKNGNARASHEDARKQAYRECLMPMHRSQAEDIDAQLLPDFDDSPTAQTCFDYRNVATLAEDQNGVAKRWTDMFKGGLAMRSEGRRAVGLPVTPADDIYAPTVSTATDPAEKTTPDGEARQSAGKENEK